MKRTIDLSAGRLGGRAAWRAPGVPRMNVRDLPMVSVMGQIAHPVGRASPYRIGHDGIPRILAGTGGIVLNFRIGDRCVGLAGDHIEPGVAVHNNGREIVGAKDGPNLALLTYCCIGNVARVVNGPCAGRRGFVTGKHGGVEHVLIDFPSRVLRRLRIGDTIQIYSYGLGLRFPDHPDVDAFSLSPRLVGLWGIRSKGSSLQVPVTHFIPAAIMGSGVGRAETARGDYDIQLFDPYIRRRFGLESLRYGDFVAVINSDTQFGRSYRTGAVTIGVVVHGDSTISGHGPGIVTLLTGRGGDIKPVIDPDANLAAALGVRRLPPARRYRPLAGRTLEIQTNKQHFPLVLEGRGPGRG